MPSINVADVRGTLHLLREIESDYSVCAWTETHYFMHGSVGDENAGLRSHRRL
jgi:hypothetical protein